MLITLFIIQMKQALISHKGQSSVEFTLILPFFFGVLFVVLTFVLMAALGQMALYGTFMAARVDSVGGDAQAIASEILPGLQVNSRDNLPFTTSTMTGSYQMKHFLTTGTRALYNPLREYLNMTVNVDYYKWPQGVTATEISCDEDDNPIGTYCVGL